MCYYELHIKLLLRNITKSCTFVLVNLAKKVCLNEKSFSTTAKWKVCLHIIKNKSPLLLINRFLCKPSFLFDIAFFWFLEIRNFIWMYVLYRKINIFSVKKRFFKHFFKLIFKGLLTEYIVKANTELSYFFKTM